MAPITPLRTTLLVLPGSSLLTVASALDPLRATNRFTSNQAFDWQVVSPDGQPVELTCGFSLPVHAAFDPHGEGDVLLIVAGFHARQSEPANLPRHLRQAWPRFRTVVALEAAGWYLARADLVRDYPLTTHWEDLEDIRQAFPELDVRADRYTTAEKFCSAGGASPTFDLMLHLIQRWHGYPLAMQVAGAFVYDQVRAASDSQAVGGHHRLAAYDARVARAIRLMEQSIDQPVTTAALARRVGLSSRGIEYAFKRTIGQTPGAYYLDLRLQAAARLVNDTGLPLQHIAVRCGFGSQSAFARSFRQKFAISPSRLRQQSAG